MVSGMDCVFPFIHGKLTTTIHPTIHYGNKYMCMVHSMYVMISHLISCHQTSSQQQLQFMRLLLDCYHQFYKATHDKPITPFWLSKDNHATLLNLPEQIEQFDQIRPLHNYWEGTREQYIHLIKQKLVHLHWTQTYVNLTKTHQSNVLEWSTDNIYPPQQSKTIPQNSLFHRCENKEDIIDQFKAGHIISDYHHPQYPKHVIVAFCQADQMLSITSWYWCWLPLWIRYEILQIYWRYAIGNI